MKRLILAALIAALLFLTACASVPPTAQNEALNGTQITTPTEEIADTAEPSAAQQLIGNKNTKVYHRQTCSYLPADENRVYFSEDDIWSGYRPCQHCKP